MSWARGWRATWRTRDLSRFAQGGNAACGLEFAGLPASLPRTLGLRRVSAQPARSNHDGGYGDLSAVAVRRLQQG